MLDFYPVQFVAVDFFAMLIGAVHEGLETGWFSMQVNQEKVSSFLVRKRYPQFFLIRLIYALKLESIDRITMEFIP